MASRKDLTVAACHRQVMSLIVATEERFIFEDFAGNARQR
jgi:hypothetical protein